MNSGSVSVLSSERAASILRLIASGAVPVSLVPGSRPMQSVAVGEIEIEAQLPVDESGGGKARICFFVHSGDVASCQFVHLRSEQFSMADWVARGEEDPITLLEPHEFSDLEHLLTHLN